MGYCKKHGPFRGTVKVSEKGQITIPKYLQDELGIKKGDILLLMLREDGHGFNVLTESVIEKVITDKKYC
jgi:AbrB family looped-hinge helix DNA binding protein